MNRVYLVFGSDDGRYWEQIDEVAVGGAPQALNQARAKESYKHYAACTKRNWAAMTPEEIVRDPVVKWKPMVPGQMTVDDEIPPPPEPRVSKPPAIEERG